MGILRAAPAGGSEAAARVPRMQEVQDKDSPKVFSEKTSKKSRDGVGPETPPLRNTLQGARRSVAIRSFVCLICIKLHQVDVM